MDCYIIYCKITVILFFDSKLSYKSKLCHVLLIALSDDVMNQWDEQIENSSFKNVCNNTDKEEDFLNKPNIKCFSFNPV